jgi:hypothetical protein
VKETLPTLASLNSSLYLVYAGYQDYFFDLYDKKVTPRQGLDTVPDVVSAIVDHIEVINPQHIISLRGGLIAHSLTRGHKLFIYS